jgi:hypothetical protein
MGDWSGERTRGGRESYRISALVLVRLIGGDEEREEGEDEDGEEHDGDMRGRAA